VKVFSHDAQTEGERRLLLRSQGPRLNGYLSNPTGALGVKRSKRVSALIDTGASMNMIDNRIAKSLGLLQVDQREVVTAMGATLAPVYYAKLVLELVDVTISGRFFGGNNGGIGTSYDMLLGRSFLQDYVFNYNGLIGRCELGSEDDLPGIVQS